MPEYLVIWRIEAEVGTPIEAALQAHTAATSIGSEATVYEVYQKKGKELKPVQTVDVHNLLTEYPKPPSLLIQK